LPLSLSLWLPLPPFSGSKYKKYRQCGVKGGGGVESCWRPYSAKFYTPYLTRFRTYKISRPPQYKRGWDLRQKNTCRKIRFQVTFFRWGHFELLPISLIYLRYFYARFGAKKQFSQFSPYEKTWAAFFYGEEI
jgi:hypothetical protein